MHGSLTKLASRFAFCYFYHNILRSDNMFLKNKLTVSINYTVESQESGSDGSASLRFGATK